ncbi:hypothetical protein BU24DRAFT_343077 [Aaosphaeria arxii CBS 175.79]|uniref:Uncharacterized protein n=1 Tax=Aaosphaeria arxii CBS 175.79 TaxID=1450172 RepID=A0A6A5XX53_9PLEO|nr:uncharacterized protein BU24DRAFT_343077 [Aaosphaeria arxii CBS 175.79]KAF2017291.1 hypothetical protein BU24DRAFT_343077 [Aaosphaeria arxii CBS 175.79]
MGAVVSCIQSIFRTIGNCLMAIVHAIGAACTAVINAIVALFDIVISCLTCGRGGSRRRGMKTRTRHTTSRV